MPPSSTSTGWVKKTKTPEELELERLLKEVNAPAKASSAASPLPPPAPPAGAAKKISSAPTAPPPPQAVALPPPMAPAPPMLLGKSSGPSVPPPPSGPGLAMPPPAPTASVAAKKTAYGSSNSSATSTVNTSGLSNPNPLAGLKKTSSIHRSVEGEDPAVVAMLKQLEIDEQQAAAMKSRAAERDRIERSTASSTTSSSSFESAPPPPQANFLPPPISHAPPAPLPKSTSSPLPPPAPSGGPAKSPQAPAPPVSAKKVGHGSENVLTARSGGFSSLSSTNPLGGLKKTSSIYQSQEGEDPALMAMLKELEIDNQQAEAMKARAVDRENRERAERAAAAAAAASASASSSAPRAPGGPPAPPPPAPSTSTSTASASKVAAPKTRFPGRSVPSSINRPRIIATANSRYVKDIYERFRRMGYLENAGKDKNWENYLFVDWDTILTDPLLHQKYDNGNGVEALFGYLENKDYQQGFSHAMETFSDSMTVCCASSNNPDRNLMSTITRIIITLDMTLPDDLIPTFSFDTESKELTVLHNGLSLVDGIATTGWQFGDTEIRGYNGNYWILLKYTMHGGYVPGEADKFKGIKPTMKDCIACSKYNSRDNPHLGARWGPESSSSSSSSFGSKSKGSDKSGPKTCGTCNGTGNWGKVHNFRRCIACDGKGVK